MSSEVFLYETGVKLCRTPPAEPLCMAAMVLPWELWLMHNMCTWVDFP